MIEVNRGLQPLREAEDAIAKLQNYESTAELASAVQATHAAVQKSLRYLLRADKGAPDDLRLVALSPTELTPDRLLPALRQRDLISMDLAGHIHELDQAAERAQRDGARAADGDLALRVVDHLRMEIQALAERGVREVAHDTADGPVLHEPHAVPAPSSSRTGMRIVALAFVAALLAGFLWFLLRDTPTEKGIAYFKAGEAARARGAIDQSAVQFGLAEQTLKGVVDDDSGNADAAYYLALIYRRSQRHDDAGNVLRRAIAKNPGDAHLREEMGNLFDDLSRPDLAARQYRLAQERDPDEPRYWIKLVLALRAAGDPEADAVMQRAPDEARAMLRTTR